MTEKVLGKIARAEFGIVPNREYLFGLQLEFKLTTGGCSTFEVVNINPKCHYSSEAARAEAYAKVIAKTAELLEKARVNHVSQLCGIPVEVTLENNWLKDYRILEEVL